MTNLSPAAMTVLDAAFGKWMEIDDIDDDIPGKIAVAALRAASHQLTSAKAIDTLLSIAAELEARHD